MKLTPVSNSIVLLCCLSLLACGGAPSRPPDSSKSRAKANFGPPEQMQSRSNGLAGRSTELSAPALASQAIIAMRRDDWAGAEQSLQASIQQGVESEQLYNLLGISLMRQGKFNEAVKAYQRAVEKNPSYAAAYKNVGILYELYLHDYTRAAQAYRAYIQLNGKDTSEVQTWLNSLQRKLQ